ncbi:MAG: hypothetical protein KBG25_07870 [Paludibacteraceae bacterium]|jgi:hypothetical protein|nr:hypothetical protein [Paludibacteraceae bacterium]
MKKIVKNPLYESAAKEIKLFFKMNKYFIHNVLISDIEIQYGEKAATYSDEFEPDYNAILLKYSLFSENDDHYQKQEKIISKLMTHLRKTVKAKWYENINDYSTIIYFTKNDKFSPDGYIKKQKREIELSDEEALIIKNHILTAEKYAKEKIKKIKEDGVYNLDHPVIKLKNYRVQDLDKIFKDTNIGCQKCGNDLNPEFHLSTQHGLTKTRTVFAEKFVEKMKKLGYEAFVYYHLD